jgi:hypothetical protein
MVRWQKASSNKAVQDEIQSKHPARAKEKATRLRRFTWGQLPRGSLCTLHNVCKQSMGFDYAVAERGPFAKLPACESGALQRIYIQRNYLSFVHNE